MSNKDAKSIHNILEENFDERELKTVYEALQGVLFYTKIGDVKTAMRKMSLSVFAMDTKFMTRSVRMRRRNTVIMVSYLCNHFDLEPIDFGLQKTDVFPSSSKTNSQTLSKLIFIGDKASQAQIRSKYNDKLTPAIKQIKKRLWLYNYMTYNYFKLKHFGYYEEAMISMFSIIESKLNNKDIKYCRVLALPIHLEPARERLLQEAIIQMPLSLFMHIWKCLKNFPHLFDRLDDTQGFFITKKPRRRYQFGFIDNHMYTQHYRFDADRNIFPELIFIDYLTTKTQKLYDTYELHFKEKYFDCDDKITCTIDQFRLETEIAHKNLTSTKPPVSMLSQDNSAFSYRFLRYHKNHVEGIERKYQLIMKD